VAAFCCLLLLLLLLLGLQGHSGYHLAPYIPPFDSMDNRWCCNAPLEALEWMLVQQVGTNLGHACVDTASALCEAHMA
jgi:hypothetical protein